MNNWRRPRVLLPAVIGIPLGFLLTTIFGAQAAAQIAIVFGVVLLSALAATLVVLLVLQAKLPPEAAAVPPAPAAPQPEVLAEVLFDPEVDDEARLLSLAGQNGYEEVERRPGEGGRTVFVFRRLSR